MTSASLRWFPFPEELIPTVFNMEVLWYRNTEKDNTYKYCMNSDSEKYTLEGLQSGTMYTAWVAVNLKSGQTVFSHRLHFVTSSLQGMYISKLDLFLSPRPDYSVRSLG